MTTQDVAEIMQARSRALPKTNFGPEIGRLPDAAGPGLGRASIVRARHAARQQGGTMHPPIVQKLVAQQARDLRKQAAAAASRARQARQARRAADGGR